MNRLAGSYRDSVPGCGRSNSLLSLLLNDRSLGGGGGRGGVGLDLDAGVLQLLGRVSLGLLGPNPFRFGFSRSCVDGLPGDERPGK